MLGKRKMDRKEKHDVKLSDCDLYWLQTLLRNFITGEANITQIEDCFPLYNKLKSIKKMDSS